MKLWSENESIFLLTFSSTFSIRWNSFISRIEASLFPTQNYLFSYNTTFLCGYSHECCCLHLPPWHFDNHNPMLNIYYFISDIPIEEIVKVDSIKIRIFTPLSVKCHDSPPQNVDNTVSNWVPPAETPLSGYRVKWVLFALFLVSFHQSVANKLPIYVSYLPPSIPPHKIINLNNHSPGVL